MNERAEVLGRRVEAIFPVAESWQQHKIQHVCSALTSDPLNIELLRHEARSNGGLLCNELRKRAWPKLLGVNIHKIPLCPFLDHPDKTQIILDVNRCGRRLPKEFTDEERLLTQRQLTRVILRLLVSNSGLCYYQGLHDVVLTFLLVLGEDTAFAVVNVLVQHHLRDFLDANISCTKQIIEYIEPLLSLADPEVAHFIKNADCQYYFGLSWIITWYSHVLENNEDILRLTDLFLASHPLMTVYVATSLIISRRNEILNGDCEMSAVHGLLSTIPEDIEIEKLISKGCELFDRISPSKIASKGQFKLYSSYMNWTHSKFLRRTSGQRPDHILVQFPNAPIKLSGWDMAVNLSFQLVWYSLPILVGVVTYWWIGRDYILSIDT